VGSDWQSQMDAQARRVISFTMPLLYQGEVCLHPATNDLFTIEVAFLMQVYGNVIGCLLHVRTMIDLAANRG